ncbi:hypothetical protein EIP91_007932 [Steccherinum ochraceum]|uniref:Uncharacterized protein n=1 Tax=Steccherinum ochraceum TaxID=92696 RepID=A0A4R0RNX4_9APHY|nr:hypothetical protein EIP91_007932 [Steccherinum ochraceum]
MADTPNKVGWDIECGLYRHVQEVLMQRAAEERERAARILATVSNHYVEATVYRPFRDAAKNVHWLAKYDPKNQLTDIVISSCLKRNYDDVERKIKEIWDATTPPSTPPPGASSDEHTVTVHET